MIKRYLRKVILLEAITISVLALNTVGANAEWKQDSTGWWYSQWNSWATGWLQDKDGKWYYFNPDGYMVHDTTIDGYKLGSDGARIQSSFTNNTITQENQNLNSDSFDINVSLKYNIHIDDKVKDTNPNIIKATRQAIFSSDCYRAKFKHYNGYTKNNDVLIFDVKEEGTDIWEVDYHIKNSDDKEYDTNSYCFAIVTKQKDGSYLGEISGSSPDMPAGETY